MTGGYFGELALLNNETRKATVKAATTAILLAIGREDFDRVVGPLQDILDKRAKRYSVVGAPGSVKDLSIVCELGQGAFGKVPTYCSYSLAQ